MEHHIRFDADAMTLYLLDQRALPGREDYLPIRTLDETIRALQVMVVRGAPAIGVTAGFGCVLALEELRRSLPAGADWRTAYDQALVRLEAARPTAVNLRWPRPVTARPWASSAAPWKRARRCGSSPTRRGPSCRVRA